MHTIIMHTLVVVQLEVDGVTVTAPRESIIYSMHTATTLVVCIHTTPRVLEYAYSRLRARCTPRTRV